jgi:glycosyltransferase involved in cell wall biosynthesis
LLSLAAELKKFNSRAKLVYDSHEYFAGWPVYKDVNGTQNKIKAWLVWMWLLWKEEKVAKEADLVITTTSSIKEKLQSSFGNKPAYIFLRNIPNFSPPPRTRYLRDFFDLKDDQYILLHSGNVYLTPAEFLQLVVQMERAKNFVFIFLAKEEKIKELSRLLSEHQKKIILFHPYVYGEKMGEVISSADIGLVWVKSRWKSHRFSSPNRLMEYLICGLPYICNYSNDAIRFVKEFSCGLLVEDFKKDRMINAVGKIIQDYQLFKNGCERAGSTLSWQEESEKLINAYKTLE